MKKFFGYLFLVTMLLVLVSVSANAAVVLYEEGTNIGTVEKVNLVGSSITGTVSGKTGTITATATRASFTSWSGSARSPARWPPP